MFFKRDYHNLDTLLVINIEKRFNTNDLFTITVSV